MALNINIDSIVRRNLAKRRLPLHYYGPMLVMAKDVLEELHFDSLQKTKIIEITLDSNKQGDLPVDFVDEVIVGFEVGDKVRPLGFSDQLNKKTTSDPFEQAADIYSLGTGLGVSGILLESYYNEYLGYNGRNFGRPVTFTDSYTILRDTGKIRLDNKTEITKIHLVYLTLPEKISNKSVIHPFAKKALDTGIDWEWAKYNKDKDQMLRRADFYNERRIVNARKNKMTTTEIKRAVRKSFMLAIKN
jgi:hypothetical protein